jgi:hypothetical protein
MDNNNNESSKCSNYDNCNIKNNSEKFVRVSSIFQVPKYLFDHSIKSNSNYLQVRDEFNIDYLRGIENDKNKIDNFYQYVVPSLAVQIYIERNIYLPSIDLKRKPRWCCLFQDCNTNSFIKGKFIQRTTSFSCRKLFVNHTIRMHGLVLPGRARFLIEPNHQDEFYCNYCRKQYSCQSKFGKHLDSFVHFLNQCDTNKKEHKRQQEVEQHNKDIEMLLKSNYDNNNNNQINSDVSLISDQVTTMEPREIYINNVNVVNDNDLEDQDDHGSLEDVFHSFSKLSIEQDENLEEELLLSSDCNLPYMPNQIVCGCGGDDSRGHKRKLVYTDDEYFESDDNGQQRMASKKLKVCYDGEEGKEDDDVTLINNF